MGPLCGGDGDVMVRRSVPNRLVSGVDISKEVEKNSRII